jgi:hypothetical protein
VFLTASVPVDLPTKFLGLTLGFLAREPISLLQFARQLLGTPFQLLQVIIGEQHRSVASA